MDTLQQAQVRYNQGITKIFLAPRDLLLSDFVGAIRAFGRFRSVRFYPDVSQEAAEVLVRSGNATIIRIRR